MFDILYPYMAHNEETRYIISFYTEIFPVHSRGCQISIWVDDYRKHKYKHILSVKGR
jgi:hypothetical protein